MAEHADQIFLNARIYTGDELNPWASGFAVKDGKLLAVGAASDVDGLAGPGTVRTELGGAFVMPGLIDVHNHHATAGKAELFELTFGTVASYQDILAAVRGYAAGLAEDGWILGGCWGSTLIGELCTEAALAGLDEAAGGRPVMLTDDSHHNRWVSTRALELAGIEAGTPDPDGGVIVRDAHTGALTGVMLEAAGRMIEETVLCHQRLSPADHRACSARAIEILHGYGVTAFQDAAASQDMLRALKELDDDGRLPAWVVTSMPVNDPIFGFAPIGAELIATGEEFRSTHHRPDFVKIFLDGVPPARTGAFLEPYLPDDVHGAHFCGHTAMTAEELLGWLGRTAAAGISAKIHCTGDASVRMVLDAVETIRFEGFAAPRYQIAHGQFIHPDDLPRLAALNVTADISPFLWWPGVIPEAIAAVLPSDIATRMHPNRDLIDSGALVAGGSDWPVSESPNPFLGIAGLVTRADPTGAYPGRLWPEQAISLDEAIAVFTRNAARAMGVDDVAGSLKAGKSADFVVLDRNPFDVDPAAVAQTVVGETWFAGRKVYQRG